MEKRRVDGVQDFKDAYFVYQCKWTVAEPHSIEVFATRSQIRSTSTANASVRGSLDLRARRLC
jgi:hypothetical protein